MAVFWEFITIENMLLLVSKIYGARLCPTGGYSCDISEHNLIRTVVNFNRHKFPNDVQHSLYI